MNPHPIPQDQQEPAGLPSNPHDRVAEAYRLAHEAALNLQVGDAPATGYALLLRAVATNMRVLADPLETAELLTRLAREAMTTTEAS